MCLTRVRRGELGVNGEDALAQLEQVRIATPCSINPCTVSSRYFGRRAQLAARAHQSLDDGLSGSFPAVVGVRAVTKKGHSRSVSPPIRPSPSAARRHRAPFRAATGAQLVRRVVSGDAIRHAAAAPPRIEAEHEPGPLQRAAVDVRPQAEAAVKAVQPRYAPSS